MGWPVFTDQACPINGEGHIQPLHTDIMNHLIIGALQEGGVNGNNGFAGLCGQSCTKADCVLFGNGDIEVTISESIREFNQIRALAHGRRDANQS